MIDCRQTIRCWREGKGLIDFADELANRAGLEFGPPAGDQIALEAINVEGGDDGCDFGDQRSHPTGFGGCGFSVGDDGTKANGDAGASDVEGSSEECFVEGAVVAVLKPVGINARGEELDEVVVVAKADGV